jgi:chemotaxis protein histidine kinase CheA
MRRVVKSGSMIDIGRKSNEFGTILMTTNMENFQALLQGIRERFLDELPERCDSFDNLILSLEKSPDDRAAFSELFRGVHSMKGSGGTHGLAVLTTICHQLENLLTEASDAHDFGEVFASRALAYVDLMRRVEIYGRKANPDYTDIEVNLEKLRQSRLKSRKAGLIAESSAVMTSIYQQALDGMPVQLSMVDNGLTALERLLREPFDFVVVGRELKELNGIALIAALRASQSVNRDIPVVLVSSNHAGIPEHARFNAILARDKQLADNLVASVQPVLQA